MKVYCYHDAIPNSGAEPIIELWRSSWEKQGWTCVILGEADFLKLPFHDAIDFHARQLPTVNDHRYERACWRRWLTMAGVGGGFLTDYDCINAGMKPHEMPTHKGKLMRFNRQTPCAVYGTLWNYLSVVDMILSYRTQPDDLYGDRLSVQDQGLLNRYAHTQDFHDLCSDWRPDHSNRDALVHFPTLVTGKEPGAKEKAIREFMKAKGL